MTGGSRPKFGRQHVVNYLSIRMKHMSSRSTLQKWRIWLKNQIVGDVPPEIGLCEFECDKTQCSSDDWEHCERRLAYLSISAKPPSKMISTGDCGIDDLTADRIQRFGMRR